MKLSVSMSDGDVEFIDQYATQHGVETRSAVVQRALALLRSSELGEDYTAAWDEWDDSEADAWESTAGDGVGGKRAPDASR
jgi:Arc/MetJ-type ribon-helix-helix transcriptional regulator